MSVFNHEYLHKVCFHIFKALGATEKEANVVSTHVVKANLVGHDSHGVIQIPVYADRISKGHIVPGSTPEVLAETNTTARINGNWGFGYVVTEKAMKLAIKKAKANHFQEKVEEHKDNSNLLWKQFKTLGYRSWCIAYPGSRRHQC
mgnify:CR=1 FL=1